MRGTEGERVRRTEKDDRRKEVGLAAVRRLLSGNTYGDQRWRGGGGEEELNGKGRKMRERMQEQKERE